MAAPTIKSTGGPVANTTTVTMPSSFAAGDLLIVIVTSKIQGQAVSASAGWTAHPFFPQDGNSARITVFYKIAAGSDTCTITGANQRELFSVAIDAGTFDSSDPMPSTGCAFDSDTANNSTIDFPGATTPRDDCLVFYTHSSARDGTNSSTYYSSWFAPDGETITERCDIMTSAGNGGGQATATWVRVTAGSFGAGGCTAAGGENDTTATYFVQPPSSFKPRIRMLR